MDRARARRIATAIAGCRILVGATAVLAPKLALRGWTGGATGDEAGGRLLARAVGVRDIALGAGAILAERHDAPVRGWTEAGYLTDVGDLAAGAIAFNKLPRLMRFRVLAAAAAAAAAGAIVSPAVDKPS